MKTATPRTGTKGVARPEREQQMIEVAGRVFGERGYAQASVADIAEAAGISKPLIYNYFASKDGLFTACLRSAGETIAADIERTANLGEVGAARAVVTLDSVFRVLEPRPWAWRLFQDPTVPDVPEVAAIMAAYRDRVDALAADGVAELMHLAGDDDPLDVDAMTAVWASVFDALVTWWLDHPEITPGEMTQRCLRLFGTVFGEIDLRTPVPPR